MKCNQPLLNRYVDTELDPATSVEIEGHLHDCWSCAQVCANLQTLKAALRDRSLYAPAPISLQRRLDELVARGIPPHDAPVTSETAPPSPLVKILTTALRLPPPRSRVWPALATIAICALLLIKTVSHRMAPDPHALAEATEARIAQEVVSSHVRSLMADHLTDVTSSDGHRLQGWFNGKVSFAPAVPRPAGFALVGARLDYLDGKPAAAVVYKHGSHLVNMFVCASLDAAASDDNIETRAERGYQVCYYSRGGLTYWTVSDLGPTEAKSFTTQVQHTVQSLPLPTPHCA